MESNYTTLSNKQSWDLSDVYYMSCALSNEGKLKEFPIVGTMSKIILAATLSTSQGSFSVQAKEYGAHQNPIEIVEGSVQGIKPIQLFVGDIPITLEVNKSPSSYIESRKVREANIERLERESRIQMLRTSYHKNISDAVKPYSSLWTMKMVNYYISQLPFYDSIVQYDMFDDVWQYNLFFHNGIELSVSVYVGEKNAIVDNVDYNIYHNGELIIANELPLHQLVKKMRSVLARIQKNV